MSTIYKKYRREWSTLVALLITFVLFSALEPSYLSATNVATIITQAVTYGLMGIGMTCVIISGGIDLSVGSSLALLACIGAQLAKMGLPIPVWIVVCLVLGFLMGAVNGVLVGKNEITAVHCNNGYHAGVQRCGICYYGWLSGSECTKKLSKCIQF